MTTTQDFTASSAASLPRCPDGTRLVRVRFKTCPGAHLELRLAQVNGSETIDAYGMAPDSWWVIECSDGTDALPDRFLRLTRGTESMGQLLYRYGFQDATGCLHHREVTGVYAAHHTPCAVDVAPDMLDTTGVPQFYPNSGVCWYCTMCWTSFGNDRLREMLAKRLPGDLADACRNCLYSREAAQTLRNALWNRYAVGDNITLPPEMDGRNGFSEFTVLCAKIGMPLIRLEESGGKFHMMSRRVTDRAGKRVTVPSPATLADDHLLVLRFQDADHHKKFPVQRRIKFQGHLYKLIGIYMGQQSCGHQIGIMSPHGDWREWSIADADLHKSGIGPVHVRFHGDVWRRTWWDAWRKLVHVTKHGINRSSLCIITPHNERNDKLERPHAESQRNVGTCSIDLLYLREEA